eukprot:9597-Chlamydomonas_euryale.AAC.1
MGGAIRRAAATPPRLSASATTPLAPGAMLLRSAIRSATSSMPGSAVAGSAASGVVAQAWWAPAPVQPSGCA